MDDARAFARLPRSLTKLLDAEPWLRFLRDTRPTGKSKRPADLVHGLDDVPPPIVTGLVGLQHVSLVRIQLIYPALVLQMAELPAVTSVNLLCLAMVALGLASILQSLPRGPIGSGFLCPSCHTGIFLEPSLAAMKLGGLPLVFGMTIMAGVLQSALSRVLAGRGLDARHDGRLERLGQGPSPAVLRPGRNDGRLRRRRRHRPVADDGVSRACRSLLGCHAALCAQWLVVLAGDDPAVHGRHARHHAQEHRR